MKFLVPNYSCLQNRPQIHILSVLRPQPNLLNTPLKKKFLGTPLELKTFTWFFVSRFPTKTLYAFLFLSIHSTYFTHLFLLDLMA